MRFEDIEAYGEERWLGELAQRLRTNGTPLYSLQELGGWESPEMVRRYAHLSAEHLAPYADQLGVRGWRIEFTAQIRDSAGNDKGPTVVNPLI